jgi:protein SCO1
VRLRSLIVVLVLSAGCSAFGVGCGIERETPRYPLKGQVIAKDTARQEFTVKHDDIPGFMPGMTMPFRVPDPAEFGSVGRGDLVTATLVVSETTGYLMGVSKIGTAPLPPEAEAGPRPRIIEPGTEVPDVTVTDQAGATRKLSDWRGKVVALTFIYTRCPVPDFCPRMDRNFAAAQRLLAADPALARRVHLLSVSFDPGYDTPEILRSHAARVGADPSLWSYVTGTEDAIDPFAAVFGVAIMRDDKPMQEILHNLRTAVVGKDGRLVTILNGNEWKAEALVAAIREADAK